MQFKTHTFPMWDADSEQDQHRFQDVKGFQQTGEPIFDVESDDVCHIHFGDVIDLDLKALRSSLVTLLRMKDMNCNVSIIHTPRCDRITILTISIYLSDDDRGVELEIL